MWDLKGRGLEGSSTGDLPNADSALHDISTRTARLEKSELNSDLLSQELKLNTL